MAIGYIRKKQKLNHNGEVKEANNGGNDDGGFAG